MTNPLRSLAARITTLVFLATVVSSLTVSWISVESLDRFLREKIDQRLPQVASRISAELDQWYTLRTREVEVFAGSAILTESTASLEAKGSRGDRARKEVDQYLRYVLASFTQFERLVLANPEGRALVDVGPGDGLPDGFLAARMPPAEATHIGGVEVANGHPLQIASVPIRDSNGRLIARLYAMIHFALVDSILQSDELGDTTAIFVVDPDQRFLNAPEGVAPREGFELAANGTGSAVLYYDDSFGRRVIGTQQPFPRFGWTVVVEQPYNEAFAPIVSSMSRVAMLNLFIVLGVGFVAFRIAGSIVKPLGALSDAAKRLSIGEREVAIDEDETSTDEVRVLTQTFNEMSRGLGRNARELEENHREIESANRALLTKNEELSNVNLVLEQLSITDGLTKLHNHRYFQDSISLECKRSVRTKKPLCLVLIDIDYFKKWNDRLGHAGGDEILRRLAEVLNQTVRETDLLARYGGEEFALLAINTTLEGAAALGEKVRQAVESTNLVTDVPSEKEILTVSVGVATFQGNRTQLFADADRALYDAKDSGRNRVVVYSEVEAASASPRAPGSSV